MKLDERISMRGKFRFKVFASGGNLRHDSDYVDNFITSTGLSYPATYAFADCFRYVSIGTGTKQNTIVGVGTTGLSSGLSQYSYIGGKDLDRNSLYENPSCGFREESNYVVLSRGWRIPTGTDTFNSNLSLQEFMVSPGRPYVRDSNNPNSKACSCDESTYTGQRGLDCAAIVNPSYNPYRTSFCEADKAFARVLKPISVNVGDYMTITYDLQLTFNTGVQPFRLPISNTVTTNWSGFLTGRANLVHHGVKLVSDGATIGSRQQIAGGVEYGESFIPPWGAPMEPSCPSFIHEIHSQDIGGIIAYLSTDNIQFLANPASGGGQTGRAVSQGEGVMSWHNTPTYEMKDTFLTQMKNVRMDGANSYYPLNTDYQTTTSATSMGFEVNFISGSKNQHTPLSSVIASSRSRTGNYSFQFWGYKNPTFWNQPVRAVTLAYYDANDLTSFYPFYDIILTDRISGFPDVQTIPNVISGYSLPYEDPYSPPPTGYFYYENGGNLTLIFQMAWSSPCDSSVIGC